jgi:hypothetical protein
MEYKTKELTIVILNIPLNNSYLFNKCLLNGSRNFPYQIYFCKDELRFSFSFYSCVHTMFGSFLPPSPTPSLTPQPPPSTPPPPQYLAETILPLFLILLKRALYHWSTYPKPWGSLREPTMEISESDICAINRNRNFIYFVAL